MIRQPNDSLQDMTKARKARSAYVGIDVNFPIVNGGIVSFPHSINVSTNIENQVVSEPTLNEDGQKLWMVRCAFIKYLSVMFLVPFLRLRIKRQTINLELYK